METDKEMTDMLRQDFIALNETNRKGVIEMTKFLVLTQNSIIPDFLGENGLVDASVRKWEKKLQTP
jgi:hypothetical protein